MALTRAEVDRLRDGVASLSTLALRDLEALFRGVDPSDTAAIATILNELIETYGAASATLASDWYDDVRDRIGVDGRFSAVPMDSRTGSAGLIDWALTTATTDDTFRTLLAGGVQQRIANASRYTVIGSTLRDPSADGWQRVTDGDSCAFCSMLAGRGAVYSEAGADFASHIKCGCEAVPAFGGKPRTVRPYTPSSRNITDADRSRVRDWIASR